MNTNILDHGAEAGGVTLNTDVIQSAIDACAATGGGRVTIPAGTYKSGTIWLKSGVELHLEMGARLLASDNMDDYNDVDAYEQNGSCPSEGWVGKHLIVALEAENCAVTGLGTVDGNCHAFVEECRDYAGYHINYTWENGISKLRDEKRQRPGQLICFVECRHVTVQDITIQNSPCWSCFVHGCAFVQIRGIKVQNPHWMLNSDGIDIDCCRDVTVSDCLIYTGDDGITLRTSGRRLKKNGGRCENVTITNCVIHTGVCAFRIGVGEGVIRHVRVSNIVVGRCARMVQFCTAYLQNGCANAEDVHFSNISAVNTALFLEAFARNGAYIRNVTMENIRSTSARMSTITAEDGCIENVTLRHVEIAMFDKYTDLSAQQREQRGDYALLLKNASNVTLEDVRIHGALCDSCGTAVAVNCEEVRLKDCNFTL